jgi:hypothetical protein
MNPPQPVAEQDFSVCAPDGQDAACENDRFRIGPLV